MSFGVPTGAATANLYADLMGDAGGLIGSSAGCVVSNCYATGVVRGSEHGGLMGYSYGTVSKCYWDEQTSGNGGSAGGRLNRFAATWQGGGLRL